MKFLLLIYIFSISVFASKDIYESITHGEVATGDHRINLSTNDFHINLETKSPVSIKANLVEESIQWVRVGEVLLKPRALITVKIKGKASQFHLNYDKQNILLHQNEEFAEASFYISLFQPEDVLVYQLGRIISQVIVHPKNIIGNKRKTHVIDYSCYRYKVEITGMDNEFLSVGCRDYQIGKFGDEKYLVELYWTSADYTLLDNSQTPYIAILTNNDPIEMTVVNRWGKIKKITIKARVPQRYKRLKTALGFGPYALYASENNQQSPTEIAPAFMIYAKFDLDKSNSLRAFDALIYKEALFNNVGVYYANDVANVYDKKITITTLLGFQGMTFKFNNDSELFNQFIFPQGLEVVYNHAFGIENFTFVYGMFLSPTESVKYNNLWIRWGKKYFWELNYIDWGYDDKYAKTWGLSIGIPFMQFF